MPSIHFGVKACAIKALIWNWISYYLFKFSQSRNVGSNLSQTAATTLKKRQNIFIITQVLIRTTLDREWYLRWDKIPSILTREMFSIYRQSPILPMAWLIDDLWPYQVDVSLRVLFVYMRRAGSWITHAHKENKVSSRKSPIFGRSLTATDFLRRFSPRL